MKLSTQLREWQGDRSDAESATLLGVNRRTYENWKAGRNEPQGLARAAVLDRLVRRADHANPRTKPKGKRS